MERAGIPDGIYGGCDFRRYADFTVADFREQLQKRHGYYGDEVASAASGRAGEAGAQALGAQQEGPRRPMRGTMLHQDGSRPFGSTVWR